VVLERDGVEIVIGQGGHFCWDEIDALKHQIERWNQWHPKAAPVRELEPEMLAAVLRVKGVMPGSTIVDPRDER
jgi:hypothetical protein